MPTHRTVIYIPIIDEGVHVWRPTDGEMLDEMVFKVLPTDDYDPEVEHWQFPPGTIVRCEKLILYDIQAKEVLAAIEQV